MSRRFDQLRVRAKARRVEPASVAAAHDAMQLLIKVIWSGFGGKDRHNNHTNPSPQHGDWDMGDWYYLSSQLEAPTRVRPVYGLHRSDYFSDRVRWVHNRMGDRLDRAVYYDVSVTPHKWVTRPLSKDYERGSQKRDKRTIKVGHYSLMPSHGKMRYCRAIDPGTGILVNRARPPRGFDAAVNGFPGRQIGWIFSADPTLGGEVKHCSEQDMMGRRRPWLGGADAQKSSLRNSMYSRGEAKFELLSFNELATRLSAAPAPAGPMAHNDVRFKPTAESAIGLFVPDASMAPVRLKQTDAGNAMLAGLNILHKQLSMLQHYHVLYPLFHKSSTMARFEPISITQQWLYLQYGWVNYTRLFSAIPQLNAMPINREAYAALVDQYAVSYALGVAEAGVKVRRWLLKTYGASWRQDYELDDPLLLKDLLDRRQPDDAIYAMLQIGANPSHPSVMRYLLKHFSGFNAVLDADVCMRMIDAVLADRRLLEYVYSNWPQLRDAFQVEHKRRLVALMADRWLMPQIPADRIVLPEGLLDDIMALDADAACMVRVNSSKDSDVIIGHLVLRKMARGDNVEIKSEVESKVREQAYLMAISEAKQDWLDQLLAADVAGGVAANPAQALGFAIEDVFSLMRRMALTPGQKKMFTQQVLARAAAEEFDSTSLFVSLQHSNCLRYVADPALKSELQAKAVAGVARLDPRDQQRLARYYLLKPDSDLVELLTMLNTPEFSWRDLPQGRGSLVACLRGFLMRDRFVAADRAIQQAILELFVNHKVIIPWQHPQQFERFVHLLAVLQPNDLLRFKIDRVELNDIQLKVLAHYTPVTHLHSFVNLLDHHIKRCVSDLWPWQSRASTPEAEFKSLQKQLRTLQQKMDESGAAAVDPRYVDRVRAAIRACQRKGVSDIVKHLLRCIDVELRSVKRPNPTVVTGPAEAQPIAVMPPHQFDVTQVDKTQHKQWRRTGYHYYKGVYADASAADACEARQRSVRVYFAGDPKKNKALFYGLDRQSGYSMRPDEYSHTKDRAICSNAELYEDADRQWPISLVTVAAPNLRDGLRQHGGFVDRFNYVRNGRLDEAKYASSMRRVWALSFYALDQQAKADGKRAAVMAPLLGGGAYLIGQPVAVKRAAIKQNILALMHAIDAQPYANITEVHLCLPAQSDDHGVDAFAMVKAMQAAGELPTTHVPVVFSQSDMFDMAYKTSAKIAEAGKVDELNVAIVNPGSDRVPGGGCYKDYRAKPAFSYGFYAASRPVRGTTSVNTPGTLELRPTALEEQLAHVTDFMYAQCASMNPHMKLDCMHAVDIDAAAKVSAKEMRFHAAGETDITVQELLVKAKPACYPDLMSDEYKADAPGVSRATALMQAADAAPPPLRRQLTGIHDEEPAAMPTRRRAMGAVPEQDYKARLQLLLQYHLVGKGSSAMLFAKNKFAMVELSIALATKVSRPTAIAYLLDITVAALRHRGIRFKEATTSGDNLLGTLNSHSSCYASLGDLVKDDLGLASGAGSPKLTYKHLQQFAGIKPRDAVKPEQAASEEAKLGEVAAKPSALVRSPSDSDSSDAASPAFVIPFGLGGGF